MTILIAEYNRLWPVIYNREKNKILEVIKDHINDHSYVIEHIGSTAVIGLAAKPVIDIMLAIESLAVAENIIAPLQRIGYKYVPEYEAQIPDRRFFHRGPSETTGAANRHFHLHVVEQNSKFWMEHLLFRDYLRQHPDTALAYASLKQELVTTCNGDVNNYGNGKTVFIRNIVQAAQKSAPNKKINFTVRRFEPADATSVSKVIIETFNQQLAPSLNTTEKARFTTLNTPEKILEFSQNVAMFVAQSKDKMICQHFSGQGFKKIC